MASLVISCDGQVTTEVTLSESPLRIGRDSLNDVVLEGRLGVSRFHVEVDIDPSGCHLTDLGSKNGIVEHGEMVRRATLLPGGHVMLGEYKLELVGELPSADEGTRLLQFDPDPQPPDDNRTVYVPADSDVRAPAPGPYVPTRPVVRSARASFALATALVVAALMAFALLRSPAPERTERNGTDSTQDSISPVAAPVESRPVGSMTTDSPVPPAEEAATVAAGPKTAATSLGVPTTRESQAKPAVGPTAMVARLPNENVADWRSRAARLELEFTAAKEMLAEKPREALTTFEALARDQVGFPGLALLIGEARERIRADALALFDAGQRAEQAGDYRSALASYTRARQADTGLRGVDERIAFVTTQMDAQGRVAYTRAAQFDGFGRTAEAVKEYERAVDLMAPDNPKRVEAARRLDALRTR